MHSTPTYLMSYPAARWRIRGGENFRSVARTTTNPRQAMKEWLALCDAIVRNGGRILVMPPAAVDPPLTGMMYTANAGALFGGRTFVVSNMFVEHRKAERAPIASFMRTTGLALEEAAPLWEGQADITTLRADRFILTWGVRSVKESAALVKARLPEGARSLEIELRNPYFHGDTCLDPMVNRRGEMVLLAHAGALVDRTLGDLRAFVADSGEVLAVGEADALGYACNALCVNGAVLAPFGLSSDLTGELARRGFDFDELALAELFGKGGGGPRCLVNELRGFEWPAGLPDYVAERDALCALADQYPESV